MGALRIKSRRDGFRRAGVAHPATWTEHPAGAFDAAQIAALRAEAMLIVEDAAPPETAPETAPGKAPGKAPEKAAAKGR